MFHSMNPKMDQWQDKKFWIIGASSGIGAALAKELLSKGAELALSGRSEAGLRDTASGHAKALVLPMDATQTYEWKQAHARLKNHWGDCPYWVIFCAAVYRPEHSWELESSATEKTLRTNLLSVYFGLEAVLPDMIERQSGGLVLVASVAGYMGLPNATVYGPSKAALINLAELLYAELHPRGLGVYLVNPGFVKTRLTARNDFPMPALQSPEQAAKAIVAGLSRGQFEISFPKRFTWWLKLIKLLPQRLRFAIITSATKP